MLTLYSKPGCQLCRVVERILLKRGLLFTKVDVSDPVHAQECQMLRDQGLLSLPVVYDPARGEYRAGVDPDWLPAGQDVVTAT